MSEILSFEEFVSKRNEARAVIKDYVIDCYIKKVKEKLLEENPGISQRQLKVKIPHTQGYVACNTHRR